MIIDKLKKIIKNKMICSFFISLICYAALVSQGVILSYNFFSILIFIFIYYVAYKVDINKKYKKELILISLILSIIFLIGNTLYAYRYSKDVSFLSELIKLKSILYIFGNGTIIYLVLNIIMPKLINYNNKAKSHTNKKYNIFLWSFIIIFICYIPYFIVYYPGILTGDSISEINMILGFKPITDHHTVLHIIYMMLPFKIGQFLFNDINFSVALISLVQIAIMSLTFAYSISFLKARNAPKLVIIGALIYYAIFPIHGFYSITMWKDILFSCSIILLTIECIKLVEKNSITIKNSYLFIIVSLLTVFSRNNGIYMYMILSAVTLVLFRRNIKTISIMLLIVFGTYFCVKGPIYSMLNIKKSQSSEYIAIPMQQIGRMTHKGVKFTNKEQKLINEVIPMKVLKEVYTPEIVDPIKFNKNYNATAFEKNKHEYLKLWLNLCYEHPIVATESYLTSTLGYWYPGVEYWITTAQIDKNELGIKTSSIVPKNIRNIITKITSYRIPLLGYMYCIGFIFWIIALSTYVTIKRNIRMLYAYIPIIGIWLTMMIASPVYAEFRYIYSAYACLPLLLGIPFFTKIEKERN